MTVIEPNTNYMAAVNLHPAHAVDEQTSELQVYEITHDGDEAVPGGAIVWPDSGVQSTGLRAERTNRGRILNVATQLLWAAGWKVGEWEAFGKDAATAYVSTSNPAGLTQPQ